MTSSLPPTLTSGVLGFVRGKESLFGQMQSISPAKRSFLVQFIFPADSGVPEKHPQHPDRLSCQVLSISSS
jgi:hypothetical protein